MRMGVWLLTVLLLAGTAVPAAAESPPFRLKDGVSQPIYSYERAIRETVWVDIGVDLDRDGRGDRVAADIIRPSETANQRVPVIMDVSPYYACCGRGNEAQKKTYAPDGTPLGFPLFYDNYFVPRGYAVVLVDVGGTNRSHGCFDDVASGRGVVDWLNGRASGYRAAEGGTTVKAHWANGSVGLIGKSQDGATAIGVASTGVEGVKTIVPIAGVSSYYEVFNSDGAWYGSTGGGPPGLLNPRAEVRCVPYQEEQARLAGTTGDYTRYWHDRNFVAQAGRMKASVLVAQGFGDLNVRPIQFGPWWDALGRHGVPRKAWLSQAGHVDPFDLQRPEFVRLLHRWMDRWLLGVRNGVEHEPAVHRETTPGQWVDERTWPPSGTRARTLWPSGSSLGTRPGSGTSTITDDPALNAYQWIAQPDQPSTARVAFTTPPLTAPAQLSGTGTVTVTVRSDKPMARVGAALVDYGPATIRDTYQGAPGVRNATTRSCWGESTAGDSACFLDTELVTATVDHQLLASGWADIGHHRTLREGEPLEPGRYYRMTFRLSTMDKVVPAGHRIGLVLGGTDAFWFVAPSERPTLEFDLRGTSVALPSAASLPISG